MNLPYFQRGQPVYASDLRKIVTEMRSLAIAKGTGYTFQRTSGGTVLNITQQASGGGGAGGTTAEELRRSPFRVIDGYPADPAYPVLRIHGESYVSVIETGQLLSFSGDPALGAIIGSESDNEDDPGQFPLPEIGHSIWIEATIDGYNVTSVSIWHGQAGVDGWMNYPDPVSFEPASAENPFPYAVTSRVLVAHVVDGTDPRYGTYYTVGTGETAETRKLIQQLKTNLGIQVMLMRGIPVPVLVPWHGPFIIP